LDATSWGISPVDDSFSSFGAFHLRINEHCFNQGATPTDQRELRLTIRCGNDSVFLLVFWLGSRKANFASKGNELSWLGYCLTKFHLAGAQVTDGCLSLWEQSFDYEH